MRHRLQIAIGICAAIVSCSAFGASDWEKNVTPSQRGSFPNPRPFRATYQFGWNDVVAATAEVDFGKNNGRLQLIGAGQTIGVVRTLWRYSVQQRAVADAATLRPILMHQVDETRRKIITTDLAFNPQGVVRLRTDNKSKKPAKPKKFNFPGLFDLHTALLFIRSQPLTDGSVQRIVVYPATNAYLATITVAAHESVTVGAGTYKAIKLDLQLSKVGKERELEPHRKFKRASVWISDDSDRLLLRIEGGVFIGTVFAELQTVEFPKGKS
ncbi:MAG TPA: DUF3108 domain-containing protein [Chthoniobacterales bacterium]|nr:DUF3108 domain-containing protein [Chthoniobacterales bacterium]